MAGGFIPHANGAFNPAQFVALTLWKNIVKFYAGDVETPQYDR
ncbi:hypothetical protein FACS1894137_12380 [Spirochaetia bacterium]|nr:hypothetical protein FACS1894137_12380 [Spirochaetia bacterium]